MKIVVGTKKAFYLAIFTYVFLIYTVFLFVQNGYVKTSKSAIEMVLNQQFVDGDPYKLSQTLTNLEFLNISKCTKLQNLEDRSIFIDLTFRNIDQCQLVSPFLLMGIFSEFTLKSVNGLEWSVSYVTVNSNMFYILFFVSMLLGITLILILKRHQLKIEEIEKRKAAEITKMARQISHDMKSPLLCLRALIPDLTDITPYQKTLLHNTSKRIYGILNSLEKIKNGNKEPQKIIHLPTILFDVLNEKKMLFLNNNVSIETNFEEGSNHFMLGQKIEIERLFSNLINNALESIDKEKGQISVVLRNNGELSEIEIKDNGKGIPKNLLSRIGEYGFSKGKESSFNAGSGIGVNHAKKVIKDHDGTFNIESNEGIGTTISITFKRVKEPHWFAGKLELKFSKYVLISDDDQIIHDLWDKKLKNIFDKNKVFHLYNPEEFKNWVVNNFHILSDTKFFIDFEYQGFEENGIDLINFLSKKSNAKAYLVTSYQAEELLMDNMNMIPKSILNDLALN